MTVDSIITAYGYPVIVLGTFFEGETVLALAGFAAHRGYLSLPVVMLMGFLGSLTGDQIYFFLGRWRSGKTLEKHPDWKKRMARVAPLIDRYGYLMIILMRFFYGFRIVIPFALGTSGIPTSRFVILNAVSALIWSVAVAYCGFLFGGTIEIILEDVKRYEMWIFIIAVAAFAVFLLAQFAARRFRGGE